MLTHERSLIPQASRHQGIRNERQTGLTGTYTGKSFLLKADKNIRLCEKTKCQFNSNDTTNQVEGSLGEWEETPQGCVNNCV